VSTSDPPERNASIHDVEQLKAQPEAMEQLLQVYEKETVEKSQRLEQTLIELKEHTRRLAHADTALATLRSMLNSMGNAVVVVDQAGRFLFLNPSAEKLLGLNNAYGSLGDWAQDWEIYLPNQTTRYPLESFPLMRVIRGQPPEETEAFVRSGQAAGSWLAPEGQWFSITARSLFSPDGNTPPGGHCCVPQCFIH